MLRLRTANQGEPEHQAVPSHSAELAAKGAVVARLIDAYDSVLFDLDGVVYLGSQAIEHAVESINRVKSEGLKIGFVTNNSSRRPEVIAEQLVGFGIKTDASEIVGSARAGALMLAQRVAPGSKVLVVGGEGLRSEVLALGFEIVDSADDAPAAVIQGFSPDVGWRQLAEASYAIQRGAIWLATNQDWTIPREGGIAPGNGTLVSAVHTAVGILPDFAGKPFAPIYQSAIDQLGISKPLFVGDRLDTDIKGALGFGMDSACVMTGVATKKELVAARSDERPTFLIEDLRELFVAYQAPKQTKRGFQLRKSSVELLGNRVVSVDGDVRSIDTLRCACKVVWNSSVPIYGLDVEPEIYS
jgi:HAD superfamily hydrolase (TIGR01450 family)